MRFRFTIRDVFPLGVYLLGLGWATFSLAAGRANNSFSFGLCIAMIVLGIVGITRIIVRQRINADVF